MFKIEPTSEDGTLSGSLADNHNYNVEEEDDFIIGLEDTFPVMKSEEQITQITADSGRKDADEKMSILKSILTSPRPMRSSVSCDTSVRKFDVSKNQPSAVGDCSFLHDICNETSTEFVHTDKYSFSCDICNKTFNNKNNLTRHRLVHTDKRPFLCHICNKTFNYKHHLTRHRLVHTDERPFLCDLCERTFSRKDKLKSHQLTHTHGCSFLCDVCNKSFACKTRLRRHQRIHTGPFYSCYVCNKSFTSKFNLKSHQLVHIGERQFSCDMQKNVVVNVS